MADPHGVGDGSGGGLVEEVEWQPALTGADGEATGDDPSRLAGAAADRGTEIIQTLNMAADLEDETTVVMEEERRVNVADSMMSSSTSTNLDHEIHATFDLEESRVLQVEEGNIASFEINRAISTVVGPGATDRHFGTWEKIEAILASIPGARNALIPNKASKLKVRDFRKIHIQEALNTNRSSLHISPKQPRLKPNLQAAQLYLPSHESPLTETEPHKPKNNRNSRPSKAIPNTKSSSKSSKSTKENTFLTPSPEWMAMMDRSLIPEPSQEGSSRTSKGAEKDKANPWVKAGKTMADVLKGGQPRIPSEPFILDPNKVKQRGTATQENGIPCLHLPDTDNNELAGRMGLALIGKFSHSIPTPHSIRKALSNFKLKGTLNWNFINAKHILITLSEIDDYVKILSGASNNNTWFIDHHPMRMFKWTADFDLYFETPIAAVWCNLYALPIHLFEESMLFSIGKLFGEPIQIDHNTITRTRLSYARICIEIDISKPVPEKYILRLGGKDVTLQVRWDKIPHYCSACKHVGHLEDHCYAFGKNPAPPKKDFSRPVQQNQNGTRGEQGGQPRGKQPVVQTETESGWNRVGKNGNVMRDSAAQGQNKGGQATRYEYRVVANRNNHPSTNLQIREPLFVPNSGMLDQHPSGKGKTQKKRSPESRERYREKRRLRRLDEVEGRAMSETEGSEFETDDGGESRSRPRSLSPTFRGSRIPNLEAYLGFGVHSNTFDILEDDDPETESSMALVLHDGTADARIIHEARRTKGVRTGAARNGSLPMEVASDGDRRHLIKGPMKKARVSTSRPN